jgi:hypothetical protein
VLYVVESYLPADGIAIDEIDGLARAAAAKLTKEGPVVRHLRSILIPEDELCELHYDAPSPQLALRAAQLAGMTSDRVVAMLEARGPA